MQRPRRWLEAASRKLKLSSLSIAVGIVDAGADQDPAAEEEEKTKEVMHFVPLCSSSSEENSYKIREKAFADPCRYVGRFCRRIRPDPWHFLPSPGSFYALVKVRCMI